MPQPLSVPGFDDSMGPSQLLLVGCEDNTTIRVRLTIIFLNKMETYLYTDHGVRVVSNKVLSFFSGHRCTSIPGGTASCGHVNEQLPSTDLWGTKFLSASLSSNNNADIYGIHSLLQSALTVTFNCTSFYPTNTSKNFISIYVAPVYFQSEKIYINQNSQICTAWRSIYCMDHNLCTMNASQYGTQRVYYT